MSARVVAIALDAPGAWEKVERHFGSASMPMQPRSLKGWFAVYGQIGPIATSGRAAVYGHGGLTTTRGTPRFAKGVRALRKAQAAVWLELLLRIGGRAWEMDPNYPHGKYANFGRAEIGDEHFDFLVQSHNNDPPERPGDEERAELALAFGLQDRLYVQAEHDWQAFQAARPTRTRKTRTASV